MKFLLLPASGGGTDPALVHVGGPNTTGVAMFCCCCAAFCWRASYAVYVLVSIKHSQGSWYICEAVATTKQENYDPTLSALDALDVASFIFIARAVTPPIYVGRRFLRARSVS